MVAGSAGFPNRSPPLGPGGRVLGDENANGEALRAARSFYGLPNYATQERWSNRPLWTDPNVKSARDNALINGSYQVVTSSTAGENGQPKMHVDRGRLSKPQSGSVILEMKKRSLSVGIGAVRERDAVAATTKPNAAKTSSIDYNRDIQTIRNSFCLSNTALGPVAHHVGTFTPLAMSPWMGKFVPPGVRGPFRSIGATNEAMQPGVPEGVRICDDSSTVNLYY